jgi:hypothetical protein
MTADPYLLGYRPSEQQRLLRQADVLVDEANRLLDEIEVVPGSHVVEIGCGPRGCLDLLAERVGPEAWDRLFDVVRAYSRHQGIDVHVERRLPRLLRDAGMVDIGVRPLVYADPPGHVRRRILEVFVDNLADRLVGDALITPGELDDLGRALAGRLDDPETLVLSDLFVQAWARKPAA